MTDMLTKVRLSVPLPESRYDAFVCTSHVEDEDGALLFAVACEALLEEFAHPLMEALGWNYGDDTPHPFSYIDGGTRTFEVEFYVGR